VSRWEEAVDAVYVESGPLPPPTTNPRRADQRYRHGDGLGINADGIDPAQHAGGAGDTIVVADVEGGWVLDHECLPDGIPLSGVNREYRGHGAAVLSILADVDDSRGGLGIAHGCTPKAFSVWRHGPFGFGLHRFSAVMAAVADLAPGDIILLEIQVGMASCRNGFIEWLVNLPAEADLGLWVAIWLASALGITVIEAAGNGNHDLDCRLPWLQRGSWTDSGAILVAAASSETNPTKVSYSNWGTRVDCHSWGENIVCAGVCNCDEKTDGYRTNFGGTSGAAAIIAGAAAAVQGRVLALGQEPLAPKALRALLSNPELGSAAKSSGLGCQPDLDLVFSKL
jgi:subtilisin family serine protease